MQKFLIVIFASLLFSCKGPAVKVASDFSGWPIDVNRLISDIQTSTGCEIKIQEEFQEKLSPTAPSGCILFVHNSAEDRREKVLTSAFTAINNGLTAKGYKIISTNATSCKTDYRFVYSGASNHGSITIKGLADNEGVQLIVCLLEDQPNPSRSKSKQ